MRKLNYPQLLSFLTFLYGVLPEGTIEEHPEKYGYETFFRNAYNPYQFIDDTDFTMEDYEAADPCWPDPCNRGGFCYRFEDSTYSCDCLSTREGLNCEYGYVDFTGGLQSSNYTEVPEIDPRCDSIDCNGNGECVLINVGALGLSEYQASCGCNMGYSEADNCLTWTGCDNVMCSNNGACVDNEINGDKTVGCVCDSGWTGETCAIGQRACTEAVLVNMVNQLAEFDQQAAVMCADIWPFVPYVSTPPTICTCLNAVAKYMPNFMDENKCVLDNRYFRAYQTISDVHEQYCTECSEQEIDDTMEIIIAASNVCEYYLKYSEDMPLYMKTYWRCQCYATLAENIDELETYMSCPMVKDSFISTEIIAFANCKLEYDTNGDLHEWIGEFAKDSELCDYEGVYENLKTVLSDFSVRASESCKTAWERLAMGTDVEHNLISYASLFCDCYDLLNAYYPAGLEWFECNAHTTHQLTFSDVISQFCYMPEIANNDCVKESMRYATLLASYRDVRGSLTAFQAMRQGAVSDTLTDSLNELMCYSYNEGLSLGLTESEMFQFKECENLVTYSWDYETNCLSYDDEAVTDFDDISIIEASVFTTGGRGYYWQTQLKWASGFTLLGCVIFSVSGYHYGKISKRKEQYGFPSKVPYFMVDK